MPFSLHVCPKLVSTELLASNEAIAAHVPWTLDDPKWSFVETKRNKFNAMLSSGRQTHFACCGFSIGSGMIGHGVVAPLPWKYTVTSKRYAWKRYKLATLLVAVALCAGIVAIVRIVLNPPVPAAIVQGRVVYSRSGSPALTVVHAQMVKSANGKPYGNGRIPRYAMAVTDMNGLYTLPKMEAGRYNIWAEKSGYTMVALDFFRCEGSTTAPDFRMIRGGVISGRVIDADTGQPAKREGAFGATIGLHGPSRPASGAAIDSAPLQDDGTFFIRAAPGRNVVYVPWARTSELSTASVVVLEGQTITVELKVTAETGNKGTEP